MELKGDDKTDIIFSGKTSFRTMTDKQWSDGTVGMLSVRKDKASGSHWIQVNSETKVPICSSPAVLQPYAHHKVNLIMR